MFQFLKPTRILSAQAGLSLGPMQSNYDVVGGGFVAPIAAEGLTPPATSSIRQINVVLNRQEEVKRRVPGR